MKYQIQFAKTALKVFEKLEKQEQQKVKHKIDALSDNPRPMGVQKLESEMDLYRIRIGVYRVIYEIRDRQLIVLVLKIGHRREIYR